jgi:Ca-activated chloride channel family protein
VTVTAPDTDHERVPVDVALVVDTSGSMGAEGKIEAARAAADELIDALRPGDRFALVTFDDQARVLLPSEVFDGDAARLHRMVESLHDDGGTNLWDGLQLGHDQLGAFDGPRKVLVVSDGIANIGETRPDAFASIVQEWSARGITSSTIGLGRDFNETLLERMADAGGGGYRFVGSSSELPAVIAEELTRTAETVARDVRVHVSVPPEVRLTDVYGWDVPTRRDGADVYIGDLAAGQSRKIVVALEAPTSAAGTLSVATADLSWRAVAGPSGAASSTVQLRVVEDPDAVAASVDPNASVAATRARAGVLARASAEAWRSGDAPRARRMLQSASDVIAETMATVDAPELADDQDGLLRLQGVAAAEGDAYAAKAASEVGRGLAR